MTQTKINAPKLIAFKIDVSLPEDITEHSIANIARLLAQECHEYAVILERGPVSGKLHAHCFALTKRSWTTSNYGKHARKAFTKACVAGANTCPRPGVAFRVNAVYNDDYIQNYMQKDPGHVKAHWHIDNDPTVRLEAYERCPNKSRDPHHNASFRSICKEYAAAHPGQRANFGSVSRFIWARMKAHRMKIESNANKMIRLVRVAVAIINDADDYDYDNRHPDDVMLG